MALKNCGYSEWALKEGYQLGKRHKRRDEEVEGQGGKDRQEEPKKTFVSLLYMKRVKKPIRSTTPSSFTKQGIPLEMQLYAKTSLWTRIKCGVVYKCTCEGCGQLYVEGGEIFRRESTRAQL